MKKIFVSDLDGTLLNNKGDLSSSSRLKLEALLKDGLPFTVATGRNLSSVRRALGDLSIVLPIIENNGVFITDFQTGEKLKAHFLEKDHLDRALEILKDFKGDLLFNAYPKREKLYVLNTSLSFGTKCYLEYLRGMNELEIQLINSISELDRETIVNIQCVGRKKDILKAEGSVQELKEVTDIHAMSSYANYWYMTIANRLSSKKMALRALREMVPEASFTVFGDNINDIGLFEEADYKIAVKNGMDELKKLADETIDQNEKDSVVNYLERIWNGTQR
ncbi:HAD-IIB family hydrolase [Guggenheimella bovis]